MINETKTSILNLPIYYIKNICVNNKSRKCKRVPIFLVNRGSLAPRYTYRSLTHGATWFPIGPTQMHTEKPVVRIPNGTITCAVSTQHTIYTLIGTECAPRYEYSMSLKYRFAHLTQRSCTHARDNAPWIPRAYVCMHACTCTCARAS